MVTDAGLSVGTAEKDTFRRQIHCVADWRPAIAERCDYVRSLVQTLSSHRHDFTERSRAEFVLRQHAELVSSAGEQPSYQQVVFGSGHR